MASKLTILPTPKFTKWLAKLNDKRAKGFISAKLDQLEQNGNLNVLKPLRKGISELRIHEGQGYRIYVTVVDQKVVVLLSGGNKKSQDDDIKEAIRLFNELS